MKRDSVRPACRPNLLLIGLDALRADHLGCYGHPLCLTPNMDMLATRGVIFARAISCSPTTGASHVSIMTGAYPMRHRVVDTSGVIPDELLMLAQVCQASGYETAAIVSTPMLAPDYLTGIDRGFGSYHQEPPSGGKGGDAAATTEVVLQWLAQRHDRPFFLWIHIFEPHGPYRVDPELLAPIGDLPRWNEEPAELPVLEGLFGVGGIPSYQVLGEERNPARYRARYAARVAYADRHLGRIMTTLEETGLASDTVTVLTADHGELLGEHNCCFEHSTRLFQPVLHVPLLTAGPGLPAGVRVGNCVSHADLAPTLLELLGLAGRGPTEQFQGNVLLPLVRGVREAVPTPRFAVCNFPEEWCVVLGRKKYTLHGGTNDAPGTLVDLEEDPGEQVDLSPQEPALTAQLRRLVLQAVRSAPGIMGATPPPPPNEEHRRQLEALGYL